MQTPANLDVPQGVIWYPSEVQAHIPHLTLAQAQQVLAQAITKHDCRVGLNWDVFNKVADEMFPGNIERFVEIIEASTVVLVIKLGLSLLGPDSVTPENSEVTFCYTTHGQRNSLGGYSLIGTNEHGVSTELELSYPLIANFGITDKGRVVVGDYVLILLGEMGISD